MDKVRVRGACARARAWECAWARAYLCTCACACAWLNCVPETLAAILVLVGGVILPAPVVPAKTRISAAKITVTITLVTLFRWLELNGLCMDRRVVHSVL